MVLQGQPTKISKCLNYHCTFAVLATAVGDEGGFAPNFQDNKEGKLNFQNL